MRAICLAYLILLDVLPFNYVVKTIQVMKPLIIQFYSSVTSSLLRPNIPLRNLFSNTLILFSFLFVTYQVLKP
jgi:hypothetical protein